MAWNNLEISIICPKLESEYSESTFTSGYTIDDVPLNLSEKD